MVFKLDAPFKISIMSFVVCCTEVIVVLPSLTFRAVFLLLSLFLPFCNNSISRSRFFKRSISFSSSLLFRRSISFSSSFSFCMFFSAVLSFSFLSFFNTFEPCDNLLSLASAIVFFSLAILV